MKVECYPISVLPHTTTLFRDYLDAEHGGPDAWLRRCYPVAPFSVSPSGAAWMRWRADLPAVAQETRDRLADLLLEQNSRWSAPMAAGSASANATPPFANSPTFANIEKLRNGAYVVVTGQQVGLFGGPLLTLLKAATAIRKAQEATAAGHPHVPVFWLATEDHDLAEVDHMVLPGKHELETLRASLRSYERPVGGLAFDASITSAVEQLKELLGYGPVCDLIEAAYAPGATLGEAFARFIASVFAEQGLIVVDASSRQFHQLGAQTLRFAIEQADELQEALLRRDAELQERDYHSQVLVPEGGSLLFLVDGSTRARNGLKRVAGSDSWKMAGQSYSTSELLDVLDKEPERISPNALLRAVFQDTIFPTSAYVGGPAEIAYFAQSQVLYEHVLGHTTPVLPRLSATLIEPALAKIMAQHELSLPDVMVPSDALAQKLGARAMPVEAKRKLGAAGNTLDRELAALTEWMQAMDESLGRSAEVAANKMLYQMNRLRLMGANYELQRNASLRKHSEALSLQLFPDQKPQERVLGGVWFLARYGDGLAQLLVDYAEQGCPGHRAFFL